MKREKGRCAVLLKRMVYALRIHRVDAYSAQSAFFLFLSFIPFLILLLSLLRFLPAFVSWRENVDLTLFPKVMQNLLETVLDEISNQTGGTLLGFSLVAVFWSASKGFFAIAKGLLSIYRMDDRVTYLSLRLSSLAYTLVFLLAFIALFVLYVFGKGLFSLVAHRFPLLFGSTLLLSLLRAVFFLLLLTLLFMTMYWLIPGRQQPFLLQLPGALLSAFGWVGFTRLFSLYTENFSNYSYLYGSLAAVIVFMLWLYFCVYILFLGAEWNNLVQADLLLFFSKRHKQQKNAPRKSIKKQ